MSVLQIVRGLRGFSKVLDFSDYAVIDNVIFRLHYRMTAGLLFLACALSTANHLIGDNIVCFASAYKLPSNVLNSYCYMGHSFTLPDIKGGPGYKNPYPGIGPDFGHQRKYHSYYMWAPFVLWFQGVFFLLPRWFWKIREDRLMTTLTAGLRGHDLARDPFKESVRLIEYIKNGKNAHNEYAFSYYFSEYLNLLNAILNIFVIDHMIGGRFLTYGLEVVTGVGDPMSMSFPLMTKCHFTSYGPSGSLMLYDATCLLPVNNLYRKIYLILWFWLISLTVLSAFSCISSLLIILCPSLKVALIKRKLGSDAQPKVAKLIRKSSFGDYFLLNLVSKNVDSTILQIVIEAIIKKPSKDQNRADHVYMNLALDHIE